MPAPLAVATRAGCGRRAARDAVEPGDAYAARRLGASPTGEVATDTGAHAVAFTGDGAKAYVSNQLAGTVSVIDVAKREVIGAVTVGDKPNGLVWRSR